MRQEAVGEEEQRETGYVGAERTTTQHGDRSSRARRQEQPPGKIFLSSRVED